MALTKTSHYTKNLGKKQEQANYNANLRSFTFIFAQKVKIFPYKTTPCSSEIVEEFTLMDVFIDNGQ